jgi:DNA-directed RNA polymerase subunit RPC12/RpoP
MIRFQCENCGYKISVEDEHAGKQGKCAECGRPVSVPQQSSIIDFRCQNCGQKISVPQVHAGDRGTCPKCKQAVTVPRQASRPGPDEGGRLVSFACSMCGGQIVASEGRRGELIECLHCGCYAEAPSQVDRQETPKAPAQTPREEVTSNERVAERQKPEAQAEADEAEQTGRRRLPWLVDIFLYPTNASGIIHLAVFLIAPILLDLLGRYVLLHAKHYGAILSLILYVFLIGYMFYYFAECIRDSALGGLRTPEMMATGPDQSDVFGHFVTLLACYAFFLGPVTFYRGYAYYTGTEMNGVVLWCLQTYGVFFFPMGVLAVVMFGSVNGLNPILLICSIASTFFQYCGLVILFYGVGVLLALVLSAGQRWGFIADVAARTILLWLLLVCCHLLGRFYRRYQERLNWEV